MAYYLFQALVFVGTASMPWWSRWLADRSGWKVYDAPPWLPIVAAVLFVVAGQLPDIHISSQTDTFQEHFVGGGFYIACLFVYLRQRLGLQLNWLMSLLALYALACSLGVANELAEFVATKLNIINIDITDTSWDLVANTTGALVGYMLLSIVKLRSKHGSD